MHGFRESSLQEDLVIFVGISSNVCRALQYCCPLAMVIHKPIPNPQQGENDDTTKKGKINNTMK